MKDSYIYSRHNTNDTESKYYTMLGDHDFLDDNQNPRSNTDSLKTLAKHIVRDDKSQKYMIKVDYTHKPYNPLSIYGNKEAFKGKDKTRPESKFIQVNEEAFTHYIKFLKTRILSWLYNTERAI